MCMMKMKTMVMLGDEEYDEHENDIDENRNTCKSRTIKKWKWWRLRKQRKSSKAQR